MIRSLLTVSSGTLASRLLGFLRDSMIAALLGTGAIADAFLVAFQLVNVARRLLSEGALNAALVPAWLRLRQTDGEAAAAFAGREDVMAHLAPVGPVYQAGTLSGNPVAATAGLTTLRLATPDVYEHLDKSARIVREAASAALTDAGVPHVAQADGTMFSVFFTEDEVAGAVRDFDGASRQRTDRFAAFFHAMLDQGVHLPPSAYEVWFLSAAHDDQALDRVLSALPKAARAAAAVPDPA